MADSIADNAMLYKKNVYTYILPKLCAEHIESTLFTLNFAGHKFVNIGIDSTEKFQVSVHLLTACENISRFS